jgi:hypothetical protein
MTVPNPFAETIHRGTHRILASSHMASSTVKLQKALLPVRDVMSKRL